jgi:hypothetical protein
MADCARRRLRIRERFDFTPEWKGPIEAHTKNTAIKNEWRFPKHMDVDDFMQEAYFVFERVRLTYPHVIEAKHFMSLYSMALRNMTTDLAWKSTKCPEVNMTTLGMVEEDGEGNSDLGEGEEFDLEAMNLKLILEHAPRPLRIAIRRYLETSEPPVIRKRVVVNEDGKAGIIRETKNEYFCRLAGVPPRRNMVAELRRLLRGVSICLR